jgi:hypothetical protein
MISGSSLPEVLKGTRDRAAREAGRENRCPREVEASAQLDPIGYPPSEIKEAPTLRDHVSAFDRSREETGRTGLRVAPEVIVRHHELTGDFTNDRTRRRLQDTTRDCWSASASTRSGSRGPMAA